MEYQHSAVIFAALAADALALGAHWIYDTQQIDQKNRSRGQIANTTADLFSQDESQGRPNPLRRSKHCIAAVPRRIRRV
jgi:hypothetical protein